MKFVFAAIALVSLFAGIQSGGPSSDPFEICGFQPAQPGWTCAEHEPKTMFSFNKELGYCDNFVYLGCGGNGNRFPNATYCETFCITMGDARPTPGPSGDFTVITNEPDE